MSCVFRLFKSLHCVIITCLFSLMYVLDYSLWVTYLNSYSNPVIMYQLCGIVITDKTQFSSWVDGLTSFRPDKEILLLTLATKCIPLLCNINIIHAVATPTSRTALVMLLFYNQNIYNFDSLQYNRFNII